MNSKKAMRLLPPGLLAYIGDAVYEIKARTYLLEKGFRSLNKIHHAAINLVNASAQAEALRAIEDKLSEEELTIVRRGRNTKTGNIPNNVEACEYRLSTGLEALFGYLYLNNDDERIMEIWQEVLNVLEVE